MNRFESETELRPILPLCESCRTCKACLAAIHSCCTKDVVCIEDGRLHLCNCQHPAHDDTEKGAA